jgi:hypothetical protein
MTVAVLNYLSHYNCGQDRNCQYLHIITAQPLPANPSRNDLLEPFLWPRKLHAVALDWF